ncbi:hypothetical protein [Roseibium sp. Sym1]|uniref:hypothetical protein n=1 Tax=Roseibium sp. Sym1 TaxID=3016006 RepID=UPI0022B455A2|nr:hypothetical protein [Roseibium sp. Sym1]
MNLLAPFHEDDPTIEVLGKTDRRLGIQCHHCGRFRYMSAGRFSGDQKISALSETLKCAACGSKDVSAVAVSRNTDNGYWPAESS